MSDISDKNKVNRKWTSSEDYRDNYDKIFQKKSDLPTRPVRTRHDGSVDESCYDGLYCVHCAICGKPVGASKNPEPEFLDACHECFLGDTTNEPK